MKVVEKCRACMIELLDTVQLSNGQCTCTCKACIVFKSALARARRALFLRVHLHVQGVHCF